MKASISHYALMVGFAAAALAAGDASAASQESILYSFGGAAKADGAQPQSSLLLDKTGALYGTAVEGGPNVPANACTGYYYYQGESVDKWRASNGATGCGSVFKLTPPAAGKTAWTESVLHQFTTGPHFPRGQLLMDKTGAIYGTTSVGGSGACYLNGFNDADGAYKQIHLGCGTVFKLTPPASGKTVWTETTIYQFAGGTDGSIPQDLTMDSSGALYGTTTAGGTGSCKYDISNIAFLTQGNPTVTGCGTVFNLTPPSSGTVWTETVLHSFTGADGQAPRAGLVIDANGALYGTTIAGGGTGASGTAFKLTPSGASSPLQVLHRFTGDKDGASPITNLVFDTAGALYGTTNLGGAGCTSGNAAGCGTVFKLSPPATGHTVWGEQILVRFGDAFPASGVVFGTTGALYGTAFEGATYKHGGVYELLPPATGHTVWALKILDSFKGGTDAQNPKGALVLDATGALYGTSIAGGTAHMGTVYKVTP